MEGIFLLGTAAFALSGYLVAVRRRLDWLGIGIVTLLSATGGGILRDLLLSRIPLLFHNSQNLWIVFATILIARLARLHRVYPVALYRFFVVADAIGLSAFSLAGAETGITAGLNLFGVVCLAFVSAVGGGLIRDLLVNETPAVLDRDVYGTIAVLMAILLFAANRLGIENPTVLLCLFTLGIMVRLIAYQANLSLPRVKQPDNNEHVLENKERYRSK